MKAWNKKRALILGVYLSILPFFSLRASASAYNVPDNAFILKGNALSVYGYGSKPVSQVWLKYECRTSINMNNNVTKILTVKNQSPDTFFNVSLTPNFDSGTPISYPFPYFDSAGNQYGPYLDVILNYSDGTSSVSKVKCSFASHDENYFLTRDSTFYYYTSSYNSFEDSATGLIYNQIYSYNCIAYVLGQSGWNSNPDFDFPDSATSAMYDEGYRNYPYSGHTKPQIIAYIRDGEIVHYGRAVSWDSKNNPTAIISKWGQLELIRSSSADPFSFYQGEDSYGSAWMYYY